jgi:hypothetical protein
MGNFYKGAALDQIKDQHPLGDGPDEAVLPAAV